MLTRSAIISGICLLILQGCGLRETRSIQRCDAYGYEPGTDAYRDCVAEEVRASKARSLKIMLD